MFGDGTRAEYQSRRRVPCHAISRREGSGCPVRDRGWRCAIARCHADAGSLDAKTKCAARKLRIGTRGSSLNTIAHRSARNLSALRISLNAPPNYRDCRFANCT